VTMGYLLRILRISGANLALLERDGVGHGGANPESALIEVGKEFAAIKGMSSSVEAKNQKEARMVVSDDRGTIRAAGY